MTTETETKSEPKPLVLAEIMAGMENYIDPNIATRFNVTFQCSLSGYGREGQLAFIESQIKPYTEFISKSGCELLKIDLIKRFSEDRREKYEKIDIFLDLVVHGRVRSELLLNPKFSEKFSNFVKGFIVKRFMESFPLPFDYNKTPFAAGFLDEVFLVDRDYYKGKFFDEIVSIPTLKDKIAGVLKKSSATLEYVESGTFKWGFWTNECIKIGMKWLNDVSPEVRKRLRFEIWQLFNYPKDANKDFSWTESESSLLKRLHVWEPS